jgi:very-short-patch-repair endonuclease
MSPIEQRPWHALRGNQLGASFRRQHPVGAYVLDFYCPSLGLAIEVDGDDHANRARRDTVRTQFLNRLGIRVVRFANRDVWGNLDGVREVIALELQQSTPTRRATRSGSEAVAQREARADLPLSGGGRERA